MGGGKGPDNIRISTSPILANPQPQADEDHWIFKFLFNLRNCIRNYESAMLISYTRLN